MKTLIKFDTLINLYPNQLWLSFSETEQKNAIVKANKQSSPVSRHNAYLNSLAVEVLMNWLTTEPDVVDTPEIWPDVAYLSSIWEFVNGTAITVGNTRLVILPSESDCEEFCVPQEWVDIPGWEADYYLAVEIELEEGWLRVCGYATHHCLKTLATFEPLDKTYTLDSSELTEDLNIMLLSREFNDSKRIKVNPLPPLSEITAEKLIKQWGNPLPYSPRILIHFQEWGALISNHEWRERIYQGRLKSKESFTEKFLL